MTGEAVALDLPTASLPSRLVAVGVDALGQLLVVAVAGLLLAAGSVDLSEAAGSALGIVLLVVVLVVYPVAFETVLRGRTPGKMAMGLRAVRDDGGPIGFRQALVRGLSSAFLEKPGVTFFVLPTVLILLHPRGKRMGDLLAGTVVARERVPVRGGEVAQMPPQLAGWAATLELSRLPDGLAQSARQFVAREKDLTARAREDLGGRLVAAVKEVTAPPPPVGTPGQAFLAAVLAERRRRETERLRASSPRPTEPQPTEPPPIVQPPVDAPPVRDPRLPF